MALITKQHIEKTLGTITSDQLSRCSLITDMQSGKNFYLVLSQTDNETEYKVTYSHEMGFQCTCKAGQSGRLCWHIKASVAHAKERKAAEMKRLAKSAAIALAKSCGMEICNAPDCLQLALKDNGHCVAHNGTLTDPGMLAFCAARAAGEDVNHGAPAWMMK